MERDFIKICLKKWRWFVASVVSALVLAIVFLLWTTPKYERTASVLIRDEAGGVGILSSAMGNMGMLAGMAGLNIASDVNNEMAIFSSPSMMKKVMNRLEMDTKYEVYEGIRKKELWKETLPVKVSFPQLTEKDGAYMKMDLRKDGSFTLYKFRKNKEKFGEEVEGKMGSVIQTPIGKISVIKTQDFDKCFTDGDEMTIRITKEAAFNKVETMMKCADIDLADDQTSIISMTYKDQLPERAELILNTLIDIYKEEWQKDKTATADASTQFINERIGAIEAELSGLDSNIANFRGRNLLPDYEEAAKMYLKNASVTYEAQVKVNNNLYMLEQMRNEVKNIEGKNIVLPANLLPDNPNVALEISEYNKLQTKRNAMAENSNDENPLVKDLDVKLKGMRDAIINSLDQGVAQLKAQQKGVNMEDRKLKGEMSMTPDKITKILPAERKQKIIEALYIYLLEKREENNMTQVFHASNMRVVSEPMGKLKPVFPKKAMTLFMALLIGLALPTFGLYLQRNIKRILAEK